MGKSMKPGGGGRFAAMVAKGVPPGAAADAGRKKYGKKKFQAFASKGRQQANALRKGGKAEEAAEGE